MNPLDTSNFEQEAVRMVDEVEFQLALESGRNALPGDHDRAGDEKINAAVAKAEQLVGNSYFVEHICPSLTVVSADAKDVIKLLAAAMLPIGLAGTISLTPLLVAALAVVIVRIGIRNLCPKREDHVADTSAP